MESSKCFGNNGKGKKTHRKIALMTRSKLNQIGKVISKALIDLILVMTLVINEQHNYLRFKKASKQTTVSWVTLKRID